MTPQQWIEKLNPSVPILEANKLIAKVVRAHLIANVLLDDMVSTTTLVDAIFPLDFAKQSEAGMAARKRIFQALSWRALARYDLHDCVTAGIERRVGTLKIMGTPCLWHAPKAVPVCSECGRPL